MEQHQARSTGSPNNAAHGAPERNPVGATGEDTTPLGPLAPELVSVPLTFVTGEGQSEPLDGVLVFDPTDPYAVQLHLEARDGAVTWVFARELLVEGLYEPCGAGDVQVWPCLNGADEAVVVIELSSPEGTGLLETSSRRVQEFVSQSLQVLPLGQETTQLPIDDLIARLLAS